MTRAEAKAAMDAGKKIQTSLGTICYLDIDNIIGPYVSILDDSNPVRMDTSWNYLDSAVILPERKIRPCNQLEILAIQTKPNRVMRNKDGEKIWSSQCVMFDESDAPFWEWAEFDDEGNLGPWHDFVVEVEEV